MKKILFIPFLIVVLLGVSLFIGLRYLNTTYLPNIIKTKIIQEAPKRLNLNVQIGKIEFNLLKGIVLHNIAISSKDDPSIKLQIERASATFLTLPLFNQKKIIIPALNIYGPKFDVIRFPGNKYNFQSLIPKQTDQSASSLPYSILIHRIDVFDSQISFLDKSIEPNIRKDLRINNLRTQINLWGVDFRLAGELIDANQTSSLNVSGSFKYKSKEIEASGKLDKLNILPYLVYFKDLPIDIDTFQLENIDTEYTLLKNNLSIKTSADITNANLATKAYLAKDKTLINNTKAKLKAALILDLNDKSKLEYTANISDLKAELITPHIPEKVRISYAKFKLSPEKIEINNSIIHTLKTKFTIKGVLENFSDPIFDLKVQSKIDLPTAKDFLRTYFDAIGPIVATGEAGLSINFIKSLSDKDMEFKGSLSLDNSSLRTIDSPYEIKSISGEVMFEKNKTEWSNLSFSLLDKSFYSKAKILDFQSPLIDLELYSDNINLRTKLSSKGKDQFDIHSLSGSYHNSKFNSHGTLRIIDGDYYLDLNLDSLVDLGDIKQIEAIPKEQLSKLNTKGKCKINGRIKGNISSPKLLNSQLNLSADELTAYGFKLDDLEMQIALENQQIKIPQSSCKFYDGAIGLNGLIDLEKRSLPFAFKVVVDSVNLAKLKLDIPIKDKDLKGTIFSTTILSGQMDSLQDFKAQGELLIQDGYLWGFNPLNKLGDFLFIPKYDTLIFREASGNFSIFEEKIALKDVVLNSSVLLLSCEGTIDFAGNLDLDLTPKAVTDVTENLDEFEKLFAGIFSEAGGVVAVKVTGTVQNPKFEKEIIALQVLDHVKDEVVDRIKSFTDLIFGTP
ncbi:AsmA-like C-terminal region-containing protein [Candidatus Omnitrophota bacterium]